MLVTATGAPLTIQESDGSPVVRGVRVIKVTNGKLTDNGGGTVTLDLSGTAGSSLAFISISPVDWRSYAGSALTTDYGSQKARIYTAAGGAQNDKISAGFYSPSGTYTFRMFLDKDTNRCITTVVIDGVSVGTIDLYSAPGTGEGTITGISLSAGNHVIEHQVLTKNASSSGYQLVVWGCALQQTA